MRRAGVLLLTAGLVAGAAVAPARAEFALTDTDRVLFFGATSLWPASFGLQVETFAAVKYPELKTRFWHWGPAMPRTISQGRERLDDHLAAFHPTIVVLNFGLDAAEQKPFDAARLAAFGDDLAGLIERCEKAGAKVVLITPNCPESYRKQILTKYKYDETVGKYAQLIREVGKQRQLPVIDWYAATKDRAAASAGDKSGKSALTTDGLHPTSLCNSLAAEAILEAWGAEPHEVTVHVDWKSLEVSTTVGTISAWRKSESMIMVDLEDFPMPWVLPPGRVRAIPRSWGESRFCKFTVHIHNAPPGGVLISRPAGRPTPWLEQMLDGGFDMSRIGPLVTAPPVLRLLKAIKRKNSGMDKYDRWTREPFPEPEYAGANAKYAEAMIAECDGTAEVIARTPRIMDVTLQVTLAQPPQPAATE